ncbi:hypothetical protein GNI_102730 [Gregarina niphandrodes]|uniref:Uncharacterized protein n=1 Tax=Gregarina niphandrodes TaxID=110365 RepID=A0A023B4M1_GRENI|nr:hypothetical protein GNI_102730 [Gregarina niphandrodes]EZG56591.1 hypothetical protein GNI_102730 [Gregarina niphandrodes]|eukprot:XP_011131226.1 hypothetical protein GNI_102730 [Gregarina niphandrodes]
MPSSVGSTAAIEQGRGAGGSADALPLRSTNATLRSDFLRGDFLRNSDDFFAGPGAAANFSPSPVLLLILQGYLTLEVLSRCSRLRNLAWYQLGLAARAADQTGHLRFLSCLEKIEQALIKSKSMALYRQLNEQERRRSDLLPDITEDVKSGDWVKFTTDTDFRNNVNHLCQMQESLSGTVLRPPLPTGYDKGSFVAPSYAQSVPRYRALKTALDTIRINQHVPWKKTVNALALANRLTYR